MHRNTLATCELSPRVTAFETGLPGQRSSLPPTAQVGELPLRWRVPLVMRSFRPVSGRRSDSEGASPLVDSRTPAMARPDVGLQVWRMTATGREAPMAERSLSGQKPAWSLRPLIRPICRRTSSES
jgi:hypothetical protein